MVSFESNSSSTESRNYHDTKFIEPCEDKAVASITDYYNFDDFQHTLVEAEAQLEQELRNIEETDHDSNNTAQEIPLHVDDTTAHTISSHPRRKAARQGSEGLEMGHGGKEYASV